MSAIESHVAALLAAAGREDVTPPEVQAIAHDIASSAMESSPEERDRAAARLGGALGIADPRLAGVVAVTLGALVEMGARPGAAADALIGRLPEVLGAARRFVAHVGARAAAEGEEPVEGIRIGEVEVELELARACAEERPAEAAAWEAVSPWCLPAIAILTRDAARRAEARADGALREAAAAVEEAGFLHALLAANEEDRLLVLHPASGRGFRLTVRGVVDNFQLHVLLADALVPRGLPGEAPSEAVAAVMRGEGPQAIEEPTTGSWNLLGWRAVGPDGTLAEEPDTDHWIWNEGRPADIEPFDDRRVVILTPPPYARTWSTARMFGALPASVEVEEELGGEEVSAWLRRLGGEAAAR